MALYITDLETESEQALELARFLSKLKSKGKETVESLIDESSQNSESEIIHKLLNETGVLFTEASEKEVEGFFFVVASLAKKLDNTQQTVRKILDSIVSNTDDKPLLRLRVLNNLYNTLPSEGNVRYTVYRELLKYADASRSTETIFNQIKESDLDAKIAEWKLDAKQKQELLKQIRDMSTSAKNSRNFKWNVKYLTSLSGEGQDLDEAVRTVVEAIRTSDIFQFDSLLSASVPVINKLENSSNSDHKLTYQLLNIFVNGTQDSYQSFIQQNPNFITSVGLNPEETSRKIRLLSLASLGAAALSSNTSSSPSAVVPSISEIPYSLIAKSLHVGESEVEMWIISAISENLITARMDQLRRVVVVTGALQRVFSQNEWKSINDSLNIWRKNVKVMLNTLQETKKLNHDQQPAALSKTLQPNQS